MKNAEDPEALWAWELICRIYKSASIGMARGFWVRLDRG